MSKPRIFTKHESKLMVSTPYKVDFNSLLDGLGQRRYPNHLYYLESSKSLK